MKPKDSPHLVVVAAVQPSRAAGIILFPEHVGKEALEEAWAAHHAYGAGGSLTVLRSKRVAV